MKRYKGKEKGTSRKKDRAKVALDLEVHNG
jgi:hypothetical protein